MVQAPARRDETRTGHRLLVLGGGLLGIGLLGALLSLVPVFLASSPMPTAVRLLALLAPIGLGVALVGLAQQRRGPRGH